MGYEYELLKAFSREHGLTLVMEVVKNQKTLYQRLNRGEGDIVAARIIPKQEDEGKVSFTHALYRTAPALVQQKAPLDQANLASSLMRSHGRGRQACCSSCRLPDKSSACRIYGTRRTTCVVRSSSLSG